MIAKRFMIAIEIVVSFALVAPGIAISQTNDVTTTGVSKVSEESEDLFLQEVALADNAEDRDSRIAHLRKALSYRPDHPDNISIEYRIAIELSQRYDPKFPQQRPIRKEALPIYEKITRDYNHMDYYDIEPVNRSMSPQLMVPGAAIHVASLLRGLKRDSAGARKQLVFAMECLRDTHEKRTQDWANAPKPVMSPAPRHGVYESREHDPLKYQLRLKNWQQRREAAAKGEVMSDLEMARVKTTVRQFGYTYGRQKSYEVPVVMGEIIKMFPGTPMAKVAQEHISRSKKITDKQVEQFLEEGVKNLQSLPDMDSSQPGDYAKHRATQAQLPQTKPKPAVQSHQRNYYRPLLGALVAFVLAAICLCVWKRRRAGK